MGMYDELNLKCPKCGKWFVFQSKCGPKELRMFDLQDAPLFVIADLHDDSERDKLYCEHCGVSIIVKVSMFVRLTYEGEQLSHIEREF